ncbi:unnamed protein product [Oncorhynchus mykiss]|uniref:Uncharacterized protein n=1 Tax=Oncorhynchus mykiss TaxID=8022 RepID=A0A060Y6U1_ONCMY|nr:unnamed protein product [Oncorhynchus mykiss]
MDVDLLKYINERLAKLDILDILREDINALCASLKFSQCQIDDLRKENTTLKGTVDSIHSKVEVVQRENKLLKESLLDVQCRSMRNNLIFSGIPENDNSRGCEDTV